jgi:carboxypeptidase C (cathepsin A)
MLHRIFAAYCVLLLSATLAHAQGDGPKMPKASTAEPPKEKIAKTFQVVNLGGKKLDIDVTTGTMLLKEEDGKATASIFYVAYTKRGSDAATRPVTFCFNGGPGSSSVWLHLGVFGPKRVLLSDEGEALAPPAKLVDNEFSLLDLTDLVFIDPVSTGFSRAAEEKNAKQFHGVQEDVQSVAEFIRLYVTRNGRWQSPKFLAGESYGTTRAAGLAGYLQSRLGMRLNGILLISTVLNFETLRFDEGNDLPYAMYLPGYTATAWYHKKLEASLQGDLRGTLAEAEKFAEGEYTTALMKGTRLSADEMKAVASKLARFTGLSEKYVLRSNLRVEGQHFMAELLRDKGRTVGRYDSRLLGTDANDTSERPDYDPSYAAVQGPFTTAWNTYVRRDLNYENDMTYEILSGRVQPWNYGKAATNRYLNVAPSLREAMTTNKDLRVFVACGYYDLATPYFASQYTFSHLGAHKDLKERVTMTYYEAGHMMYIHKPSLVKLREDIGKFMGTSR